ncbi:probable cyclic nucleotide-gated ion channel 20, chloroplastic isoform X1, partial [Tanacetum coccineum]
VRIFSLMDEPFLDAICERLRQKTYVKGGTILYQGGFVTKMVFIVRGKMESIGEDGSIVTLCEGDACGEELLKWCLEHSSINGDTRNQKNPGYILLSNRMVKCLTNVEAFVLRAADLKEVTTLFARYLRNHRVQISIRKQK